jgi:hypothetical protein
LQGYAVSSTDWQFRNGYEEFMAVIWRVETFDRNTGKSMMSGWMEEHFAPGQISDGWTVEAGHCKARNAINVQVKCAVKEGQESACFKDSSGNHLYPYRGGDFRADHSPAFASPSGPLPSSTSAPAQAAPANPPANIPVAKTASESHSYWYCSGFQTPNRVGGGYWTALTEPFLGPELNQTHKWEDVRDEYKNQFYRWFRANRGHPEWEEGPLADWERKNAEGKVRCRNFDSPEALKTDLSKEHDSSCQDQGMECITVKWNPTGTTPLSVP